MVIREKNKLSGEISVKTVFGFFLLTLLLMGGIYSVSATTMTDRLEYPEYWLEQGVAQFTLKNYDRALSLIDTAIKQDSTLSSAWMWRGKVLNKMGRTDEARESDSKAIELDPLIMDPFRKKVGTFADIAITPIPTARPPTTENKLEEMIQSDVDLGKKPDPTGPDMVLYDLQASIPDGTDRVAIVASIGNEGLRPSRDFFITFYGSYETPVNSDDTPIGFYLVSNLLPGTKKTIEGFFPISQIPSGNYYIGAYIDPNNEIMEVSETNNGRTATLKIDVPEVSPSIGSQLGNAQLAVPKTPVVEEVSVMRADLVIDKVSGPDTAAPGSSIAVTTLVRNAGDADAGPFRLSMHLSQDTKVSSDDIMLGYGDVPDLAAGKAREGTAAAVIPAKVKPGTYYLVAMADSLGKITESDKQNNSRAQDTPIIIRSDIPSDSIENNVSILKEQPTQTPPSPTSLTEPTLSSTIIVEPTPTPTTTPVEIATPEPTPEVIKAQSEEVPTPVTDKENSAPDSSLESSKSSSSSLLPDLMPLDVSADSTGIVGEPLQVSTTIYNDGPGDAGPFTVSLILSTDTRIDELKDIILGTGQIESLPAGKQRMGNATFPISSDIKPGKYYFGLFVDSKREINETDEDNNYGYNKIPVIISSR